MRKSRFWWVVVVFMLLLDLYFSLALQVVAAGAGNATRRLVFSFYWLLTLAAIGLFWALPYMKTKLLFRLGKTTVFSVMVGLFIAKLIASLFFLGGDIYRLVQ